MRRPCDLDQAASSTATSPSASTVTLAVDLHHQWFGSLSAFVEHVAGKQLPGRQASKNWSL